MLLIMNVIVQKGKYMALEIKYFILKPRSKFYCDPFAYASREAMRVFATMIQHEDTELAASLMNWANKEAENNDKLQLNKNDNRAFNMIKTQD